jgi:hypothetical protein
VHVLFLVGRRVYIGQKHEIAPNAGDEPYQQSAGEGSSGVSTIGRIGRKPPPPQPKKNKNKKINYGFGLCQVTY